MAQKKYANKEREMLRKVIALRNFSWDFFETEIKLRDAGFLGANELSKVQQPFDQKLNEIIDDLKLGIFNLEAPNDLV